MPKYLVNIIIAFIIFLVAASLLSKSDEETAGKISDQISAIEQGGDGIPVEDGSENPGLDYYQSSWLARTLFAIGDIIAGAIKYLFDLFANILKTVLD